MARRSKQISFLKPQANVHGGVATAGNPREKRPLSTKLPIHLVLKSSRAVGARSMLRKQTAKDVKAIVDAHAKVNGVKVYRYANSGNHLHLVVKITNRALFLKFLRVVSGLIARLVLGAEKNAAKLKSGGKFWDARPFTRVSEWGRAFDSLCRYLTLNTLEALGFVKHSRQDDNGRKFWTVKFDPDPPSRTARQAAFF